MTDILVGEGELVKHPKMEETSTGTSINANSVHCLKNDKGSAFVTDDDKARKENPVDSRAETTLEKNHLQHQQKKENDGGSLPRRRHRREKDFELEKIPFNIPPELIPSNAVDITVTKSGKLWKVLVEPGDDKVTLIPRSGNLAWIHYKCWFANDPEKKVFDSSNLSSEDDEPVCLNIGKKQVIRAIDVGIRSMMKRGEKALFIAHYDYAYGKKSSYYAETSNIPNGSFICVEVTLVDIEDASVLTNYFGKGITREIIALGDNGIEEANGNKNEVHGLTSNSLMFVKLEGYKVEVIEEEQQQQQRQLFLPEIVLPFTPCFRTWGYSTSGKVSYPVPYDLGNDLRALRAGDKIIFTFSGDSAFPEDFHCNGILIKAREPVKYLVTVEEVEEITDPFLLSLSEKVECCKKLVDRGIMYQSHGWHEAAACKFTRVQEYLKEAKLYLKKVPRDLGAQCDELLYFAFCKLASLFWNMPEMGAKTAVENCSKAIKVLESMMEGEEKIIETLEYGDNTEAYRLRARLYVEELKEYGLAKIDLDKILVLTEKAILKVQHANTQKMMEMKLRDCDGDIDKPNECDIIGSDKMNLDKLIQVKTATVAQLKKADELERNQKKSLFVLKYVPPK